MRDFHLLWQMSRLTLLLGEGVCCDVEWRINLTQVVEQRLIEQEDSDVWRRSWG